MKKRMINENNEEVIKVETKDYNLTKAFDLAYDEAKENFEGDMTNNFENYSTAYGFKLTHIRTSLVCSEFGEERCFEYEFMITDKR